MSPARVLGISDCVISVWSRRSGLNAAACPLMFVKSNPMSRSSALCVRSPFASTTHSSSTFSSFATLRSRATDFFLSRQSGFLRSSGSLSRNSIACRTSLRSTFSRMAPTTSLKATSISLCASRAIMRSCSSHVNAKDATKATVTAPASRATSFRCAVISPSFP